jgi:biotin transport system substrate-specific component
MPEAISTRTLLEAAWPQAAHGLGLIGAVAVGVGLLTLSAKLQVPFWPVPMTLQTLAVLLLGMAYGPGLGLATVIVYLLVGAIGLPVFAGTPERGIGLTYMAGPTAGFLAGFVLAAAVAGYLARWGCDKAFPACAAAMLAGHVLIVLAGVAWLAMKMGPDRAIEVGLLPFLLPALAKSAIGAVCMPLFWRALGTG